MVLENRMDDATDLMATVDAVSSLRMVRFACGDVLRATFPTTVSRPKMADTSEQTIALVVDKRRQLFEGRWYRWPQYVQGYICW